MNSIQTEITKILLDQGADLIGFTELTGARPDFDNLHYAVSIATALETEIVKANANGPTIDYYNEYKRIMKKLNYLGLCAVNVLNGYGYQAVMLDPSGDVDLEKLSTLIPHKMLAVKSGMGWIGKNGVLVTKEYGAAVMLVSVLTSAAFEVGLPTDKSGCGTCNACADACPANAIKGEIWEPGVEREVLLDAFACEKTADERGKIIGVSPDETVCGICISVCPFSVGRVEEER